MSGYNNRLILLQFPELGDKVSVLIRNPKLVPPEELTPKVAPGPDGQLSQDDSFQATYEVAARLIVAWHVYDASAAPVDIDMDADNLDEQLAALEQAEQPRLGPVTPDNVAKLPTGILNRIGEIIQGEMDPQ